MSQTTTQQRAHRITMPKPQRLPSRSERMQAEAEQREADAREMRQAGQRIGSLLPASVQSPPPSETTSSPRTGGQPRPDAPMPSSADAPTSQPTSLPASTTTAAKAPFLPTSTPPGGLGAVMQASTAGQQLPADRLTHKRLPTAAFVVDTAMREIALAKPIIDCLPRPLASLLSGKSETELGPMEAGQIQCPSLTLPHGATASPPDGRPRRHVTHVRLRQRGYETLKAYVEAQGDLASIASYDERLAAVGEGVQVWKNRLDAVFSDDAGTEIALATWADALDGWPLWVLRAAFRHCNTTHRHPPMPVDVLAVCEDLWGEGRRQMIRARKAVADIERLRPEWCE